MEQPAFSIVVPVHNVVDYLAECLDSILSQSYRDFEVIAVDDASTDASPDILAQYAQRDSRINVVHLETNVGLGMARNAGMERAGAPYLLFVDSDDTLATDAVRSVADRIADTGSPDVVMFGFARTYPDGRVVPDERSAQLAPPACLPASDRPQLLEILPTAWNKAYRRDFVTTHGFRFPTGVYEDVPWSYPVLMTAERVATLDRVCYLYRQRRSANLLSRSGLVHLDLLSQYDRVFGYLDAHPDLESWRRPLVDRITRHVPTVLETAERIPRADRRAFFHAASESFRKHRPPEIMPSGSAGLKVRLIERDRYAAFRAAQLANRVRRWLRPPRRSRPR